MGCRALRRRKTTTAAAGLRRSGPAPDRKRVGAKQSRSMPRDRPWCGPVALRRTSSRLAPIKNDARGHDPRPLPHQLQPAEGRKQADRTAQHGFSCQQIAPGPVTSEAVQSPTRHDFQRDEDKETGCSEEPHSIRATDEIVFSPIDGRQQAFHTNGCAACGLSLSDHTDKKGEISWPSAFLPARVKSLVSAIVRLGRHC